jgi:hypothetical protein
LPCFKRQPPSKKQFFPTRYSTGTLRVAES